MSEKKEKSWRIEGRCERWWFSTIMTVTGEPCLFGAFYGLESIGFKEGQFEAMDGIEQIDFAQGVVVTEKAYVKLGEKQTLADAMARIIADRLNPVRIPDKK